MFSYSSKGTNTLPIDPQEATLTDNMLLGYKESFNSKITQLALQENESLKKQLLEQKTLNDILTHENKSQSMELLGLQPLKKHLGKRAKPETQKVSYVLEL